MDMSKRNKIIIIVSCSIVGLLILIIVLKILLTPHNYTMQVKTISWKYDVHIEELKVVHKTDESTYPSDAYNVDRYTKTKSETYTDKDGNMHTRTKHVTRYNYDVNRWIETRVVTNAGFDHNPSYGEFTLKESSRDDGIGGERVGHYTETYTASGVLINSEDTQLKNIDIPKNIWDVLKLTDQLNYKQRMIGDPYDIEIAM